MHHSFFYFHIWSGIALPWFWLTVSFGIFLLQLEVFWGSSLCRWWWVSTLFILEDMVSYFCFMELYLHIENDENICSSCALMLHLSSIKKKTENEFIFPMYFSMKKYNFKNFEGVCFRDFLKSMVVIYAHMLCIFF